MEKIVTFDIPVDLAGKLATGKVERIGGIIRNSSDGSIVRHLREVNPLRTAGGLSQSSAQLLGLLGSGASLLNLGATIGFGVATLSKLNKMDKKLDVIDAKLDVINAKLDEVSRKLDRLKWTVEFGFARTLQSLERVKTNQEIELMGELTGAMSLAWSAQFLEPGSPQRMTRMENIVHSANMAREKLIARARERCLSAIPQGAPQLITQDTLDALTCMRQAIIAVDFMSSILSETDEPAIGASRLRTDRATLSDIFSPLVAQVITEPLRVYSAFLEPSLHSIMPAARLDHWIRTFDPERVDLATVLDLQRMEDTSKPVAPARPVASGGSWMTSMLQTPSTVALQKDSSKSKRKSSKPMDLGPVQLISPFIDSMEGIHEDLRRLQGNELELLCAADNNLTMQQYREQLSLEETADTGVVLLEFKS